MEELTKIAQQNRNIFHNFALVVITASFVNTSPKVLTISKLITRKARIDIQNFFLHLYMFLFGY